MTQLQYTPDAEIKIESASAIRQLAQHFGSHEAGIPEWAKNAADAYIREQMPRKRRIIVLIFEDSQQTTPPSIACLDFVGMTSQDIEHYFRRWADTDASQRGTEIPDIQGGHGHGGKAYMIRLFDDYAYLHTVRGGRGCTYGVAGGQVHFGYMPTPEEGRDFIVDNRQQELERALAPMRVQFEDLPKAARQSFAQSEGFTLVRGVSPKGYENEIGVPRIISKVIPDPQMVRTLHFCDVYVIANGIPFNKGRPITLPRITPMKGAEAPVIFEIPTKLVDPVSGRPVSTTGQGELAAGKLILRTSERDMRYGPRKYRHNIWFVAGADLIGLVAVRELGVESRYRNRIYGECFLDALEEYKQSDRRRITESPLTRALNNWIREQIEGYCKLFEKRDQRVYSHKERRALSRINAALDGWKNQFIDELMEGLWTAAHGRTRRRQREASAGRPDVPVEAGPGEAQAGLLPQSSAAFYEQERAFFQETLQQWGQENPDLAGFATEPLPESLTLNESSLQGAELDSLSLAEVFAREVIESQQEEAASVSENGWEQIPGRPWEAGEGPPADKETTKKAAPRKRRAQSPRYPQILISGIDPDPDTGWLVQFAPEDPPVVQEPRDVERNIWWINSAAPLAKLYLDETEGYGYASTEWRVYHLERVIEIMAKIRLSLEAEWGEDVSYDTWAQRWNEIAAQMQEQAAGSLREFIDEGKLPRRG